MPKISNHTLVSITISIAMFRLSTAFTGKLVWFLGNDFLNAPFFLLFLLDFSFLCGRGFRIGLLQDLHCFFLLLLFSFGGLIGKPFDDHHHVFWVSVLHVMQVYKILLIPVKQSIALIINFYLEELRWVSLRWQIFPRG